MTVIKLPPLPKLHTHDLMFLNLESIHARDLEVVQCVLGAAAQRLEIQAANLDILSDPNSWDASASSVRQSICYILAMRASHDN